uniref:Uncharacterized protein n=1 Tax=Schistocephalus solidus TaxID=70667 RepID=A0A0X3PC77_SCHSO
MWPLVFPALLVSITFAEDTPSSNVITQIVKINANFDFITRVPVTLSFSSSDCGFVQCFDENDCGPHKMNVQFFPRRQSLQIYGDPKDGTAKLTIVSMKREQPNLIIIIVGTSGHYPSTYIFFHYLGLKSSDLMQNRQEFPLTKIVHLIKMHYLLTAPFCSSTTTVIFAKRHYMDTFTFVFDEPIREITLEGPITKYEGGIRTGNAEVFIPYESMYVLMRATGRIETSTLSLSFDDLSDAGTRFFIHPMSNMENMDNPIAYIRFPK